MMRNVLCVTQEEETMKTAGASAKERIIVFCICFMTALCAILPFVLKNNGLLTLSHDFNAQEFAFNMFANREIKAGNLFFNWAIDIGSDFTSSLSFYNLGSPFFWISLIFKPEQFPFVMPWIFMLKYAVAGVCAFIWLRRYIDDFRFALLGALLYTFSGFQAGNMVFYHFHDAVAFFPLFLLGVDAAVHDKKWGVMAAAVGINALVNWNFFVGEVIFVILYYIVRYDVIKRLKKKEGNAVLKEVLHCLAEGLLGGGIAAIILLPSVMTMLGNTRINNHIVGKDALVFSSGDYVQFFRALFFPGEPLHYSSAVSKTNWYSINAYLPLVGVIPVIVLWKHTPKGYGWLRTILVIALVTALIPFLNNIFVLLNEEPYRRWYYMPILLMSLAASLVLKDAKDDEVLRNSLKKGSLLGIAAIVCVCGFLLVYPWESDGTIGIYQERQFLLLTFMGIAGLIMLYLFAGILCRKKTGTLLLIVGVLGYSLTNIVLNISIHQKKNDGWNSSAEVYSSIIESVRNLKPNVLPYRYTLWDSYNNRNMTNSMTSVNSFISTVDNGIFEFYDAILMHRHTGSPTGQDGIADLLSSRYTVSARRLNKPLVQTIETLKGPVYVYDIGESALPIGFGYDSYVTRSEFDDYPYRSDLGYVMLRTLVVNDADEAEVSAYLMHYDLSRASFSRAEKTADLRKRRASSSENFHADTTSFGADFYADQAQAVFFSVPYSKRWTASVNGEPARILNINGLMAVLVQEGQNQIEFTYDISVNVIAGAISMLSLAAELVLLVWMRKKETKKERV